MRLTVNGEGRLVPDGVTIGRMLEIINAPRQAIAVEVNREIVPRVRHDDTSLSEGDVIEIVTFVGGG